MFFEILYFLIIATSIILLIMENRKPYIAIFWVIILILLPVVGLLLYLLLGKDYRSHRVIKPDEMHRLAFLRDSANHHLIRKNTHSEKYDKLSAMMLHANDAPLFDGNNVRIFTDFTPMFQSMLDDIEHAQTYVHIQFYKIEDDEVGRQLSDLLIRKAQQGLDVRLMYDSFANLFVSSRYYDHMRRGGVHVQSFLKLIPSMFTRDVNCRTHRKIVVVDGTVGYTGGMNIARRYRDGISHAPWRDTHSSSTAKNTSPLTQQPNPTTTQPPTPSSKSSPPAPWTTGTPSCRAWFRPSPKAVATSTFKHPTSSPTSPYSLPFAMPPSPESTSAS